ncbi:tetratricopeptide repeat protein [bacterium]|nr:tetratricopeptide repeat protein [bacterium]
MINLLPDFIQKKYEKSQVKGKFTAAVLFLDISGFTSMTEKLMEHGKEGAEIMSLMINNIFNEMISAVYKNGGFISTFAGDAFTAIFRGKYSVNALHSANSVIQDLKDISIQKSRFGTFNIGVKIGISYGTVKWGILGDKDGSAYYFQGDPIIAAAECEKHCSAGEVIFDDSILEMYKDAISYKKRSGKYILTDVNAAPVVCRDSKKQIQRSIAEKFLPAEILELNLMGEFRNAASIFLNFEMENFGFKLLNEFITFVMHITRQTGGYLNLLDFGDKGNVIFIVFGAPVSYENNIFRALDLVKRIGSFAEKRKGLTVRGGISYGAVYAGFIGNSDRGTYTMIGDNVNQAARFTSNARKKQIWTDENIAGKMSMHYSFKQLPIQKFKGKGIGVIPHILGDRKVEDLDLQFKSRLVGRKKELDTIKRFSKPIFQKGFAGVFYIYGTAGIGKSRLVYEFASNIRDKADIFVMKTDDVVRKPFNPFIYTFSRYFQQNPSMSEDENHKTFDMIFNDLLLSAKASKDLRAGYSMSELERTKSMLAALIGLRTEGTLYDKLDPKGRYENTLVAIKEFFKLHSIKRPLVMILEDIHWLDADSISCMKDLTRNIDDFPMAVYACARYAKDKDVVLSLEKEIRTKKLHLQALRSDAIFEIIGEYLGSPPVGKLKDYIENKTHGNPFFIEQYCLFLKENEYVSLRNDEYELNISSVKLPANISAIIIARIDKLTKNIKDAMYTAAVLGMEFDVRILSEMLKRSHITDVLTAGENEDLWYSISEIRYIFKHSLLRETAYEMQLRSRLRKLHSIAAGAMSEVYEGKEDYYSDLAYHYEMAEEIEDARKFLRLSAEYSQRNFKNHDSIDKYQRLYTHTESNSEKVGINNALTTLLIVIGDLQQAHDIASRNRSLAQSTDNAGLILESEIHWARVLTFYGKYSEVKDVLGRFTGKKSSSDNAKLAFDLYITLATVEYYTGDMAASTALTEKAAVIAQKNKQTENSARASGLLGIINMFTGQYDAALEHLRKQEDLSKNANLLRQTTNALANIGNVYYHMGEYDIALEKYQDFLTESENIGDRGLTAMALGNIANIYLIWGDHDRALELYAKQQNIALEMGDKYNLTNVYVNIGTLYQDAGKYSKAIEYFGKAKEISKHSENIQGIINSYFRIGLLHSDMNDHEAAIAQYEQAEKYARSAQDSTLLTSICLSIGESLSFLGRFQESQKYMDEALHHAESAGNKFNLSNYYLNQGKALSIQGKYEKALRILEKGEQISGEMQEMKMLMQVEFYMGVVYMKLKRYSLAGEYLNKSLEKANTLGNKISLEHIRFYLLKLKHLESGDLALSEMVEFCEDAKEPQMIVESCILLFTMTKNAEYLENGISVCEKYIKEKKSYQLTEMLKTLNKLKGNK